MCDYYEAVRFIHETYPYAVPYIFFEAHRLELTGAIIFIGLLLFLAHAFVALFERTRVPDVLLLIIIGLLLGPMFDIVEPADFGRAGQVFTVIALVVLLYNGGFRLSFAKMADTWKETILQTLAIYAFTFGILTTFIFFLTPLFLPESVFVGAVLAGPAPSLMAPAMRHFHLSEKTKALLRVETPLGEAVSVVVALAVLRGMRMPEMEVGIVIGRLFSSFIVAAVVGGVGAYLWSLVLFKVRRLYQGVFLTPSFVFILFGVMEYLGFSGPIAVLIFGIVLGNIERIVIPWVEQRTKMIPLPQSNTEKQLTDEVAFIVKTFFFVFVGMTVQFTYDQAIAVAVSCTGFLVVARLIVLQVPFFRRSIPSADVLRLSVMIPKGTAAAVLAGLPLQQGIAGAALIQDLSFGVITFSIFLASLLMIVIERFGKEDAAEVPIESREGADPIPDAETVEPE